MKRIMFVCKHNSRRSQMAEGFVKAINTNQVMADSAGLESSYVDPLTVDVMSEVGIDISQQASKPLNNFDPQDYDAVISLCGCGVNLPQDWVLREIFEDWQLDDPAGQPVETFRRVRDEVKERVDRLVESFDDP